MNLKVRPPPLMSLYLGIPVKDRPPPYRKKKTVNLRKVDTQKSQATDGELFSLTPPPNSNIAESPDAVYVPQRFHYSVNTSTRPQANRVPDPVRPEVPTAPTPSPNATPVPNPVSTQTDVPTEAPTPSSTPTSTSNPVVTQTEAAPITLRRSNRTRQPPQRLLMSAVILPFMSMFLFVKCVILACFKF